MAHDLLEKELMDLPEASIADVVEYVRFLKFRLSGERQGAKPVDVERKHPQRRLGILQGRFVMADDFDETPDCFKEYM